MPFLAEEHIDVPNKDLLSWMFDDPKYDQNAPVRTPHATQNSVEANSCRFTLTPPTQTEPYHRAKLGVSRGSYAQASSR